MANPNQQTNTTIGPEQQTSVRRLMNAQKQTPRKTNAQQGRQQKKGQASAGLPAKLQAGQEAATARGLGKEKKQSRTNATKSRAKETKGKETKGKIRDIKQKVQEAKDVATQAGQQITSEALRQSWLNLITSYGLTLLYINFHFLAKYFGGIKYFSEFGEEWDKKLGKAAMAPGIGKVKSALKWLEIIALLLIDVIIFVLILLAFIAIMLPVLLPIIFIGTVFATIFSLF